MCDDERQENAESHPAKKWYDHKPTLLTTAIAGLLVYSLFIFIDVHDIWPLSRLAAVIVGIVVTIALVYLEAFVTGAISFLTFVIFSIIIFFAGLVIYRDVPETHHSDVEVVGTLQPGNDPDPPNSCPPAASPETWKVLFGKGAVQFSGTTNFPLLKVGKCDVLSIKRDADGLSIGAALMDSDGKLIGTIKDNVFHAFSGEQSRVERDHNLSKLIVFDGSGKEILYVHYVNRTTVQARGVFGCPGHRVVAVRDGQPIPGMFMNTCVTFAPGISMGALFSVQ